MTGPAECPFRRVAIVGLGLMGGSFARGLKSLPSPPHIRAVSLDPEEIRAGVDAGAVDEGAGSAAGLLEDRDLLVYAAPLRATIHLMEEHRPFIPDGTVITDMVSLKEPILAQARRLDLERRFVGSHPMVGGTGTGFAFSTPGLYREGRVWLVPGEGSGPGTLESIRALWEALGAHPAEIPARDHDDAMAWVSHLPQLTSNALALALKGAGFGRGELGSGGADMTRLAGSAPGMWKDLLAGAPKTLPQALLAVERSLAELRALITEGNVDRVSERMAETRDWVEERP